MGSDSDGGEKEQAALAVGFHNAAVL